ncbi:MAG: ankyrin repeat domain-containing protein [Gammaproteobacteria bacterium]|nr:ankyrin repeat domain-containing protein [Gammaproteobacteria bacterium]
MSMNSSISELAILERLLEHGVDINEANNEGDTPLHMAASCNNFLQTVMAQFLLNAGADPDLPNKDGDTALHLAVKARNADLNVRAAMVKVLLDAGANSHLFNNEGKTPEDLAFESKEKGSEVIQRLLGKFTRKEKSQPFEEQHDQVKETTPQKPAFF